MDDASLVIGGNLSPLDKALSSAVSKFAAFGVRVKSSLDSVAEDGGLAKVLGDGLKESMSADLAAVQEAYVAIEEATAKTAERVKVLIASAFGPIGSVATKVADGLQATWSRVTSILVAPFQMASTAITNVIGGIRKGLASFASMAKFAFTSLTSYISNAFSQAYAAVKQLMPLMGVSIQDGLSSGFAGIKEDEIAFSRMEGLITSTGGAAGFTGKQLSAMANAAAEASGAFGGDAFANAYATLLQFKNLRGEVFLGTTKAIEDMAIATGGDLSAAADKLGRALDDPIRGVRVLKSEGIKFTETEAKMIEQMIAAGNVMGAQQAILQRVGETYKGNAAVAAGTFTGKMRILNQALEDQWKAWSQALIPAIEAVIPYLMESAKAAQRLGEKFGELVKWTVDWAKQSEGTIRGWYDYVVDVFLKVSDVIVDSIAKAFAFVRTAVEDLPKFFNVARAKAMVVWEELTQNLKSAWETVSVAVQNGWDVVFHHLKMKFIDLTAFIIKASIDLNQKLGLLSKDQADLAKKALKQASGFAKQNEEERLRRRPKAVAKGQSEEDKKRLEDLRAAAIDLADDFGDRFNKNLAKSKGFFDGIKTGIRALVTGAADDAGAKLDEKFKKSNQDFTFSKDPSDSSSKGAFEDLQSLQKRIQGASFKDPAAGAIDSQTHVIKAQHKESIQEQREQQKKIDKQIEVTEKINETMKANAGLGEIVG